MNEQVRRVIQLAIIARCRVFSLNIYDSDMSGACGLVSWYILFLANHEKLYPTFIMGDGHCWVKYFNYIIDATAQQFEYPCKPVHVIQFTRRKLIDNNVIFWDKEYDQESPMTTRHHAAAKDMLFGYSLDYYEALENMFYRHQM